MQNKSIFNPKTSVLLLFILTVGAVRVAVNFSPELSPLAVFSPLGAMALFGGAYFNARWKAFSLPLLTLFVSDVILHQTVFRPYGNGLLYDGWYWVYGAFVLMEITGRLLLRKVTVIKFVTAVMACVLIHWIVTDFGMWLHSKVYAQTVQGFIDCLIAAIPFEGRFFAGTIVYGSILFGSLEWIKSRHHRSAVLVR